MGHISFFFNLKEKCQINVISDIISYAYYIGIELMIIPVKILFLIIIYHMYSWFDFTALINR